jgi:hypothetical protein
MINLHIIIEIQTSIDGRLSLPSKHIAISSCKRIGILIYNLIFQVSATHQKSYRTWLHQKSI